MSVKLIEFRPPRIAITLLVVATFIQILIPSPKLHVFSSIILSCVSLSTGFLIMMLAWSQFRKHQVAICPTEPTELLITNGLYRYSRNPMYLGMVTMLGGVALFFGTLHYYLATILYFVLIDQWFCSYEEEKLAATFGHDYERYKSKVRRWI